MSDNDMHIAPGRILAPKLWDDERQYAKEEVEVDFKSVGYLLTAHAAGLAGCMTLLKDYNSTPQLKGIGIFILLFGLGFIFGAITFMSLTRHRQVWMTVFLEGRPKVDRFKQSLLSVYIPGALSLVCLMGAVVVIITKFYML